MINNLIKSATIMALLPAASFAATLNVPTLQYRTIQSAVDAAQPGDEIRISARLGIPYTENVTITTDDITLRGVGILDILPTRIIGSASSGKTGTIVIDGANGVTLRNLSIFGFDGPSPGIETAAVYIKGDTANVTIQDNFITAVGDSALLSEYGVTTAGLSVIGNSFLGTTFIGLPAGEGTGQQFILPNVPRPAVVIGGPNTSHVTFTGNNIAAITGGYNIQGQEQGRPAVTIESEGSLIEGNTFIPVTTRTSSALYVGGSDAIVQNNSFTSLLMGSQTAQLRLVANAISPNDQSALDLYDVYEMNSFDNAAFASNEGQTIYKRLAPALAVSADDATVYFQGEHYGNITIENSITLKGLGGEIIGSGDSNSSAISIEADGVVLETLSIIGAYEQGSAISIAAGLSDITIVENDIIAGNAGIVNRLPGGNTDITIVGNEIAYVDNENGQHIYLHGEASSGTATVGTYISGNVFEGATNDGLVIGIEGNDTQISRNFFGDTSSSFSIIEIWNGDAVIDGNCFAASSGAIIKASGGADVNAAYNFFGASTGPVAGNADGINTTPYLTSCEASYILAIQNNGGTISPDFIYLPASAPATFTITPTPGYEVNEVFTGDLDSEGNLINPQSQIAAPSFTFPASTTGNKAITATYNQILASITSTLNGGNGTLSPIGTTSVAIGGSKTFIATPAAGYSIVASYTGNGTLTQGAGGLLTVSNITGTNNELSVSFVAQGYTVSYNVTGQYASIVTVETTDPLTDVTSSDEIVFTVSIPAAAANAGVRVTTVRVNGVTKATNVLNGQSFTLTGVNQNSTVEFVTGR